MPDDQPSAEAMDRAQKICLPKGDYIACCENIARALDAFAAQRVAAAWCRARRLHWASWGIADDRALNGIENGEDAP